MAEIRNVKESSSKRLAFCPNILRKIRYVDNSGASSTSHSRDTSPDKNQITTNGTGVNNRNSLNHQPQACTATSNVITAIQIQPVSFQRQPSLPKASPSSSNTNSPVKQAANGHQGQYSCHSQHNSPHISSIVNSSLSNHSGHNSSNACCNSNGCCNSGNGSGIKVNSSPGLNGTSVDNANGSSKTTGASCCMVITSTTNGNSSNILVVSSPTGAVTTRCINHVTSTTQSTGSTCITSNTSSTLSSQGTSSSSHPHPHRSLDTEASLLASSHCCCSSSNCNNCVNCSSILTNTPAGLIESRKITSSRELKLSFFTDESPTHSQPPTITIRMKPDDQGRFGFNVKVSKSSSFSNEFATIESISLSLYFTLYLLSYLYTVYIFSFPWLFCLLPACAFFSPSIITHLNCVL